MEEKEEKLLPDIRTSIRQGKAKNVKALIIQALESGISVEEIVEKALICAMEEITEQFSGEQILVPDVIQAFRAVNAATVVLEDYMKVSEQESVGTVVAATVRGDQHNIGLNLVCMVLKDAGFTVYNMGCDVPLDAIIKKAQEVKADIICVSAMLTTTMSQIQGLIKLLENRRIRDQYYVMIGGAPVTESFAKRIGADIYTRDAAEAAREAKKLMEKRKKRS